MNAPQIARALLEGLEIMWLFSPHRRQRVRSVKFFRYIYGAAGAFSICRTADIRGT
jgi:hypothetical protein